MSEDFEYRYGRASIAEMRDNGTSLLFAHCSEVPDDDQVPCFFYGYIKDSFVAARCMSTLAKTTSSHFAISPDQRIYLRDPIVSAGNRQLRFEAFSSCNSVYARVDIVEEGVDGDFLRSGCTNVDFNAVTIRAFNAVKQHEKLLVGVGAKQVDVITERTAVVEKKVTLPDRWIKGLGNVQVYLSDMEFAFRLSKVEALQLFKTLPSAVVKGDYYLYRNGLSYQFSPSFKEEGVKIGGIHRLNLLTSLLLLVDHVSFYRTADGQSAAVLLTFKSIRMTFLLSENVYRGFSGEGRNLEKMIEPVSDQFILGVNTVFKTNEVFLPTLLSIEHDVPLPAMDTLQAGLSSIGLLGFDLGDQHYFYRRLPFKMTRLKSFNPRMVNATKLVQGEDVVIVEQREHYVKAEVKGSAGVWHTVVGQHASFQCTCTWYTAHQTNRGLCKHILAVKMTQE
jgi:hypothetical protein